MMLNVQKEMIKLIEFQEFAKENNMLHLINELDWQQQFNDLAERLPEHEKVVMIGDRTYRVYEYDFVNWSYGEVFEVAIIAQITG
jgi:hypothetical protein